MFFNYHTHTPRCHHATGTEREYIEAFIKAGVKVIGFSDHVPLPYSDDNKSVSGVRMLPSEAEEYINTISALREEYKNDIEIHVGFEAEYDPEIFPFILSLGRRVGAEYFILGQHYTGPVANHEMCKIESADHDRLVGYADSVVTAIETGKYTYIAHPDVLNYPYDDEFFREQALRICTKAKEFSVPLEFNLYGFAAKKYFPSDKFFRVAAEVGNDVVLGRDVHTTGIIFDTESEKAALEKLSKLGITPLSSLALRPL